MGNSGRRPRRTRRSKQRVGRGFAGGKAQRDGWNRDSSPYEYSLLMASSVVNHRTEKRSEERRVGKECRARRGRGHRQGTEERVGTAGAQDRESQVAADRHSAT